MRKAIIFIVSLLTLTACNETGKTKTIDNVSGTAFDVIEVDSCEYIIGSFGYRGYMAHKGNCKYCEQRMKKLINRK